MIAIMNDDPPPYSRPEGVSFHNGSCANDRARVLGSRIMVEWQIFLLPRHPRLPPKKKPSPPPPPPRTRLPPSRRCHVSCNGYFLCTVYVATRGTGGDGGGGLGDVGGGGEGLFLVVEGGGFWHVMRGTRHRATECRGKNNLADCHAMASPCVSKPRKHKPLSTLSMRSLMTSKCAGCTSFNTTMWLFCMSLQIFAMTSSMVLLYFEIGRAHV